MPVGVPLQLLPACRPNVNVGMAEFTGPSMSELPGWRIGIIFIIFFTVAFAWDAGTA